MSASRKPTVRGIYKSYEFGSDNPVLDALDRVYELTGMVGRGGKPKYRAISEASTGVSVATLQNWRKRKVRRPQQPTLEAVLRGLGAETAVLYKGHVIRFGRGRSNQLRVAVDNTKRRAV